MASESSATTNLTRLNPKPNIPMDKGRESLHNSKIRPTIK
jgi:hypothetical protein